MLLYLAFNGVHAGVQAPQSFITKYQNLGLAEPRRTLCAAVDCMDLAIGRVLTTLDQEGMTHNTVVVFISDNGGNVLTGSLNEPLRGSKNDVHDGGIHTPAAICWPGHLADGVNLWLALQTISTNSPDGVSRGVPLVTGDAGQPVALDSFTDPVAGGTKTFKLIQTKASLVYQLFELTTDPYETTDLLLGTSAASYTTIFGVVKNAITAIAIENDPPYIGPVGITQAVVAGSTITLYAPFTSYRVPTVQWRKFTETHGTRLTKLKGFYRVAVPLIP